MAEIRGKERRVGTGFKCPKDYVWLKKGDPYMTRHCREITLAGGKTLFTKIDAKERPVGLYLPQQVYEVVKTADASTKEKRQAATKRKDALTLEKARVALNKSFPAMPKEDEEAVLTRAWKKSSGRVGRTETISMEVKVKLGVTAHARHAYTEYDELLKQGFTQKVAREKIKTDVEDIVSKWQGMSHMSKGMIRDSEGEELSEYSDSDPSAEATSITRTLRKRTTAMKKTTENLTSENAATETRSRKKAARPAKRAEKVKDGKDNC
ncbi:uncharacterized protein J3D65DRAFT_673267 [Phyllosticta citribraziliensis]|uniref:DUF2293 domain-containing protein n=1 Tax=Phyllosticta citribraziliensis TaxID=989973 RepID=A0ABR1M9G1_9PEZI